MPSYLHQLEMQQQETGGRSTEQQVQYQRPARRNRYNDDEARRAIIQNYAPPHRVEPTPAQQYQTEATQSHQPGQLHNAAPLTSAATPPAWDDRPANTEHDDHLSTSPARSYALGMGPVEPIKKSEFKQGNRNPHFAFSPGYGVRQSGPIAPLPPTEQLVGPNGVQHRIYPAPAPISPPDNIDDGWGGDTQDQAPAHPPQQYLLELQEIEVGVDRVEIDSMRKIGPLSVVKDSPGKEDVKDEVIPAPPVQKGSYIPWEGVKYKNPPPEEPEPTQEELRAFLSQVGGGRGRRQPQKQGLSQATTPNRFRNDGGGSGQPYSLPSVPDIGWPGRAAAPGRADFEKAVNKARPQPATPNLGGQYGRSDPTSGVDDSGWGSDPTPALSDVQGVGQPSSIVRSGYRPSQDYNTLRTNEGERIRDSRSYGAILSPSYHTPAPNQAKSMQTLHHGVHPDRLKMLGGEPRALRSSQLGSSNAPGPMHAGSDGGWEGRSLRTGPVGRDDFIGGARVIASGDRLPWALRQEQGLSDGRPNAGGDIDWSSPSRSAGPDHQRPQTSAVHRGIDDLASQNAASPHGPLRSPQARDEARTPATLEIQNSSMPSQAAMPEDDPYGGW